MLNLQEIFDQGSDLLADAIKFESNNKVRALKLYNESLVIFSNVDKIQSPAGDLTISTKKNINDNIELIKLRLKKLTIVTNVPTIVKPLKVIDADPKFINIILGQLVTNNEIKFNDIAGQEEAKQSLKEMVIWPNINPKVDFINICNFFLKILIFSSYFQGYEHQRKDCCYLDRQVMVRRCWQKQ